MVLKAIFVDEPAFPPVRHVYVVPSDLLPRTAVVVLAMAVFLLGVAPEILAAPILAAVP